MHGLIHQVVKSLVLRKFGQRYWTKIVTKAGIDRDAEILEMRSYDDAITLAAVTAAINVLSLGLPDLLREVGVEFVNYVIQKRSAAAKLLLQIGDNMPDLLCNLNSLHQALERKGTFRSCHFPVFKVEQQDCSRPDSDEFVLSYFSQRDELLVPLIEGLLPALGAQLFDSEVKLKRMQEPTFGFIASWRVHVQPIETPVLADASDDACATAQDKVTPTCGNARCVDAPSILDWHAALASIFGVASESKDPRRSESKEPQGSEMSHSDSDRIQIAERELANIESLLSEDSDHPADLMMRAVDIKQVAAEWDAGVALDRAITFWDSNRGDLRDYGMSKKVQRADRFVTHCWGKPDNWNDVMGTTCSYAYIKAVSLALISQDLLGSDSWGDMTVWIDKACIPQRHMLMRAHIDMIEDFIHRCDGMVVLMTWHYFSRLWCVYEWASFLVYHHPSSVRLTVDFTMRPDTVHLFIDSVKNFTVASAECHKPDDRPMLMKKIKDYYVSAKAFEKFVKCTAIALFARFAARPAGRSSGDAEELFWPWVHLAEEQGFSELVEALVVADPHRWKQLTKTTTISTDEIFDKEISTPAMRVKRSASASAELDDSWQGRFIKALDVWFDEVVCPVLDRLQVECVHPQHLPSVQHRRSSFCAPSDFVSKMEV
mmetsp:Transcript_27329/g.62999  ORF Transcript_27329/g.62999 Transcript_27329/m.62999 type:complete len:658 (-) Transcript_27329:106-2079(-)